MDLTLHDLTSNYASLREALEKGEADFKAYKSIMEQKISEYQAQILEHMNSTDTTKIATAVGDFTRTTKQRACITSAAELEQRIMAQPDLIQYMVLKPKVTAIKKYVDENAETPCDLITYERYFDIMFRRAK